MRLALQDTGKNKFAISKLTRLHAKTRKEGDEMHYCEQYNGFLGCLLGYLWANDGLNNR